MKKIFQYRYVKPLFILILIIVVVIVYDRLSGIYVYSPDAYVEANVIPVSSVVAGAITHVFVVDNQPVKIGQKLFTVDTRPYEYGLQKAHANLLSANAHYQVWQAPVKTAQAELEAAQYQLNHTTSYALANGYVTNVSLRVGQYVERGQSLFALVETGQWWVTTHYRETDISHIKIGDKVRVTVAMYPGKVFHGVVDSIGWGINRLQASPQAPSSPLKYLQPTEDWIRIAQRFPVRITILNPDPRYPLRVGATASTIVMH